eukprot:scaffold3043_cov360-Prasinococcus_capsulatus_cf.AAC.13
MPGTTAPSINFELRGTGAVAGRRRKHRTAKRQRRDAPGRFCESGAGSDGEDRVCMDSCASPHQSGEATIAGRRPGKAAMLIGVAGGVGSIDRLKEH